MGAFQIIYSVLIRPLQIFFEYIFSVAQKGIGNPGLSIIVLSLTMNLLVLPLYNRADEVQEAERKMESRLRNGVAHIKKTFKGDEKMMMLQTYYRQNGYKPTDVFKGSVSLLLEIPFFVAAYQFLSHLSVIQGKSFGPITDLGAPDALITIGLISINILPIIMTAVNLTSCVIFTKGYPLKTKIQLYGMAVFFFFFLYKSPAGLVFYWTLNNIFSLVKTIYYKSAKARNILNVVFCVFGVMLVLGLPGILKITGSRSKSFVLIVLLIACVCFVPLLVGILKKKIKKPILTKEIIHVKASRLIFTLFGIYMVLLTGFLIPSQVIKSSPQEFVDVYHFSNPLWFVVSSICISAGTFILWFGVFYSLAGDRIKKLFMVLLGTACVIASADYMFFGKNAVILNSALKYTEEFQVPVKMLALNILVAAALGALAFFLLARFSDKIAILFVAGSIAFAAMSVSNCVKIQNEMNRLKEVVESINAEKPALTLSKDGQNVIVFMLDRAFGLYMPYFINEKPELATMYDGFTYYPNTVSFGNCTNYGSPAVFGGYEYTPYEMDKRDDELLKDKHDEALLLMPSLFYENGYNVTVCDPPYAGYNYVTDYSIYDDYPGMKTYRTKGYYWQARQEGVSDRNYRNFFCYSLMKCAPLVLRNHLYNDGLYNENLVLADMSGEISEASSGHHILPGNLIGMGIWDESIEEYSTLLNLSDMTVITDDATNNFLVMDNETTHACVLMQEPEYVMTDYVDNTEYEANHRDRYTLNGVTLKMDSDKHYVHYQTNMAVMLRVGEWLDYLKKEGVYDNTRIIIVADHGRWLGHNDMFYINDNSEDKYLDLEAYYPLLMIKDFDAHGFTTDEQFMTNADVPTYAMQGLIDNPVNPFTGKLINNDEKYAHPQIITASEIPDIEKNNGTTFLNDGYLLSVEKDMRDKNNWKIIEDFR